MTIRKKSVKKLKTAAGSMPLNDKSLLPMLVYDGNRLLTYGKDYTLLYADDMTASKGKKTVTVKALDDSNYTDSMSVKVEVTITGKGDFTGEVKKK